MPNPAFYQLEFVIRSRAIILVLWVRHFKCCCVGEEAGSINNSVYQRLNDVGKSTATEDLQMLVEKGIFK
jgi:hypothetical protein